MDSGHRCERHLRLSQPSTKAATRLTLCSPMITLLAIDTAAPRLQLALLASASASTRSVEDMAQGQAERIFPAHRRTAGAQRRRLCRSHPHRRDHRAGLVHRPAHRPQRRARARPGARHPGDRRSQPAGAVACGAARRRRPCCSMRGATRPISSALPGPAIPIGSRGCCRWTRRARRVAAGRDADRLARSSISRALAALRGRTPIRRTIRRRPPISAMPMPSRRRSSGSRGSPRMMKLWMAPHGPAYRAGAAGAMPRPSPSCMPQGFYRGWPREDFAAYIAGDDTPVYVACDAKRRIAGFAMLRLVGDEAELITIAVDPQMARARASALALMRALFEDLLMSAGQAHVPRGGRRQSGGAQALRQARLLQGLASARATTPGPTATPATALVMARDLG